MSEKIKFHIMRFWLGITSGVALLSLFILPGCSTVSPIVGIPENAQNCNLKTPPDGSGENFIHGTQLFIYPREVAQDYTGCQTMWADDGTKWMVLYIEAGHPRLVHMNYPFDKKEGKYSCVYQEDALVNKDEKYCNPYEKDKPFGNLLLQSVSPRKSPKPFE